MEYDSKKYLVQSKGYLIIKRLSQFVVSTVPATGMLPENIFQELHKIPGSSPENRVLALLFSYVKFKI